MGHAVEPLVDRPRDVALACHADLGEALQAALQLGQLRGLCLPFAPPAPHMHDHGNGERRQRHDREARERQHDQNGIEGDAPHLNRVQGHENL